MPCQLPDDLLLEVCRLSTDDQEVTQEVLDDLRAGASLVGPYSARFSAPLPSVVTMLTSALGRLSRYNPTHLPFGYSGPALKSPGWVDREDLERIAKQIVGLLWEESPPEFVAGLIGEAIYQAISLGFVEEKKYDAWRPGMSSGSGWRKVLAVTPYGIAKAASNAQESKSRKEPCPSITKTVLPDATNAKSDPAKITVAWGRGGPSTPTSSALPPSEAFDSAFREMAIHEDRVTLCGVTVWTDRAQQDVRDALVILSRKNKDGFIRMKGPQLDAELGRNASNPMSGTLHGFCTNATAVLKREKDLDCGRYDIIDSRAGGYHFRQWMKVQVVGAWATELGLVPETDAVVEEKPPVNPRQQWVLDQIDAGRKISQKDVLSHFNRECDPSTVKRDLKGLREAGLIETGAEGHYVRSTEER